MKCLPRDLFVKDEILSNLICSIGYGVFRDPVALPCQHVFCRPCIEASNDGKGCGICSICCEPWSREQLKSQVEVAELINLASVKCPHCEWTGQYQVLDKHTKTNCPNSFVTCQYNCGISAPRKFLAEHEANCPNKKVECETCKKSFLPKEFVDHQGFCPDKDINCPVCQSKIKQYEIEIHSKTVHKGNEICMFSFAGCYYVPEPGTSLEIHYKEAMDKHLDLLCTTVSVLQSKMKELEKRPIKPIETGYKPDIPMKPQVLNIRWNTGATKLNGSKKSGWSFFLSSAYITGNFIVKIRINALGNDANTWKICLGVFNSNKYQAGSWDKFKNGWGYILGNGNVIHENPSIPYGASYGIGDNIWIEHKNGKISFYKNGVSPGPAFNGIIGPFYIAAALSDIGHSIELIEVVEIN